MFPASSKGGGQCMAFPDVCKTPSPAGPVPIPYPNIAMPAQGNGSSKVKIVNMPALNVKSDIPMSSGDEAGTLGGVVSSKFKGDAKYKMGCTKVKIEGSDAVRLTSMIGQNGGNNANMPAGTQVAPSQAKVFVMS